MSVFVVLGYLGGYNNNIEEDAIKLTGLGRI